MKIDGVDYPPERPRAFALDRNRAFNKFLYFASFMYLTSMRAMAHPMRRSDGGLIVDQVYDPEMPRLPYYDNPSLPPVPPDDDNELWTYWKTVHYPVTAVNTSLGIVAAGDHTVGFYDTIRGTGHSIAACFDFSKFMEVLLKSIGGISASTLVDYTQEYCYIHYKYYSSQFSQAIFDSAVYGLTDEDCERFKANYQAQIDQCVNGVLSDVQKFIFFVLIVLGVLLGAAVLFCAVTALCSGVQSACSAMPSLPSFRNKQSKSMTAGQKDQDKEGQELQGPNERNPLLSDATPSKNCLNMC